MKKLLYMLLGCLLLSSLLLGACDKATPTTTTSAPPVTTTQAPEKTTTTAPVATTEKPTPTVNKYGGILRQALTVGPARPIGYPPEAAPDSYTPATEGLVSVQKGGVVVGILATKWTVADDGKSITFELRKGVKFHDGSDFNADVAKWNMDLEIAAKRAAAWTSVDVIDPYTIRLNITQYQNTMMTDLSSLTTMISKESFDKNGIEWARWNPVGTGPFIFVEYQRDAKLTLKRNPDYWDTGKPYFDGLEFTVIADETVRKLAFEKGDIDVLTAAGLTAQELKGLGFPMNTEPFGTFVLIPNSKETDSPWAIYKVRLAASYALDREALAKALGFGFARPAYQVYPGFAETALPNFTPIKFDQAKAKELLKEAGYPDGFSTTIHAFTRIVPQDYINAVANQLREVGIQVTTDFPEAGKYEQLRSGTWDGLMGHALSVTDNKNSSLNTYFNTWMFPDVAKPDGWLDALNASLASREVNPTLLQKIIQIMNDNLMVIPYMEETKVVFYQKGIHDDGAALYSIVGFDTKDGWMDQK